MNHCSIENKLCSIATKEGKCPVSACIKKNETIHAVYKEGKKVWPPEDPVDIHDELSKSTTRIENVIREEMAKISGILRQAIVDDTAKPCSICEHYSTAVQRCLLVSCEYKPARVAWIDIPDACKHCRNHPSNGGSGICNCTLGTPKIDCSWK